MKNSLLILAAIIIFGLSCKQIENLTEKPSNPPSNPPSNSPNVQKEETPEEAIRAMYSKIDRAMMDRNESELYSFASDDYTTTDQKGKVTSREVAIKDMKQFFKLATEITDSKSDVFRVEQKDGLWNASVTAVTSGKVKANGKTSTFESKIDSDEQWAKNSSGQWKCIRSITRRSTVKVDGKEVKQ